MAGGGTKSFCAPPPGQSGQKKHRKKVFAIFKWKIIIIKYMTCVTINYVFGGVYLSIKDFHLFGKHMCTLLFSWCYIKNALAAWHAQFTILKASWFISTTRFWLPNMWTDKCSLFLDLWFLLLYFCLYISIFMVYILCF